MRALVAQFVGKIFIVLFATGCAQPEKENTDLVHRLFEEGYNQRKLEIVEELIAPNVSIHTPHSPYQLTVCLIENQYLVVFLPGHYILWCHLLEVLR